MTDTPSPTLGAPPPEDKPGAEVGAALNEAVALASGTPFVQKDLALSKSVYGPVAALAVGWAAARFGLNLDPNTSVVLSGALVLLASAALRFVTQLPVTHIFNFRIAKDAPHA